MNRNQLTDDSEAGYTATDVEVALDELNDAILSDWREIEDAIDRGDVQHVYEDDTAVVLADISGEVSLDAIGGVRDAIRHVHETIARELTDYDWADATPVVVEKPDLGVPRPESGERLWMSDETDFLGRPLAVVVGPTQGHVVSLDDETALTGAGTYIDAIDEHQLMDASVAWDGVEGREQYVHEVRHDLRVSDVHVPQVHA